MLRILYAALYRCTRLSTCSSDPFAIEMLLRRAAKEGAAYVREPLELVNYYIWWGVSSIRGDPFSAVAFAYAETRGDLRRRRIVRAAMVVAEGSHVSCRAPVGVHVRGGASAVVKAAAVVAVSSQNIRCVRLSSAELVARAAMRQRCGLRSIATALSAWTAAEGSCVGGRVRAHRTAGGA